MKHGILLLWVWVLLGACKTSFEKIQKSKDTAFKLTKADEYFDHKQWTKANQLYEELLPVYKGTKNFEPIYYRYAFTFYNNKDFLAASYHFKNYADLFPDSYWLRLYVYLRNYWMNEIRLTDPNEPDEYDLFDYGPLEIKQSNHIEYEKEKYESTEYEIKENPENYIGVPVDNNMQNILDMINNIANN